MSDRSYPVIVHAPHDLQALLATMKSAKAQSVNMNIWDRDIKTVEDAITTIMGIRGTRDVAQRPQVSQEAMNWATEEIAKIEAHKAAAVGFCEWLQGYFKGDLGRDDLTVLEANQIRNELNARVYPGLAVSSTDGGSAT